MRDFIGLLLISGYNTIPCRRLYWSLEPDVQNEMVTNYLRRNRLDGIAKYFHTTDNTNLSKSDKFTKIRPLLTLLNERFLWYGAALESTDVSIDASIIPY